MNAPPTPSEKRFYRWVLYIGVPAVLLYGLFSLWSMVDYEVKMDKEARQLREQATPAPRSVPAP